jgi:hypothetical protein
VGSFRNSVEFSFKYSLLDFRCNSIIQVLSEIENKDITITPVRKKRRASSESQTALTTLKLQAPKNAPLPTQVPPTITLNTKNDLSEFLNIKVEPREPETNRNPSHIDLRQPKDTRVQEILNWAKTHQIKNSAVDALFDVLKIKRFKMEIKQEPIHIHRVDGESDAREYFIEFRKHSFII